MAHVQVPTSLPRSLEWWSRKGLLVISLQGPQALQTHHTRPETGASPLPPLSCLSFSALLATWLLCWSSDQILALFCFPGTLVSPSVWPLGVTGETGGQRKGEAGPFSPSLGMPHPERSILCLPLPKPSPPWALAGLFLPLTLHRRRANSCLLFSSWLPS